MDTVQESVNESGRLKDRNAVKSSKNQKLMDKQASMAGKTLAKTIARWSRYN